MRRYRVCVYAICKDEEKFVDRWVNSMSEADEIVVLDTGSTDNTVARLKERGVKVFQQVITPWRFDVARNRSLELVPDDVDICVCTDLDEVFRPEWRDELEAAWTPDTSRATYQYSWSFNEDGSEDVTFWYEKIHTRHGYTWVHPVHEILVWTPTDTQPGPVVEIPNIHLDHYPDPNKSRAQYLPLLELSVQEMPDDDRNMHYLGREYLYHFMWDECISTLKHHLDMPSAVWADERAASMRYIGVAYIQKGEPKTAMCWYLRAIAEAPYLREPWIDAAMCAYGLQDFEGVVYFTGGALSITEKPKTYICGSDAWGSLPHDLRSFALSKMGCMKEALKQAELALVFEPGNQRLIENVATLNQIVKNEKE